MTTWSLVFRIPSYLIVVGPKRRFEKAAFEAREVLRQLKDKEKVLLVDLGDPDRPC